MSRLWNRKTRELAPYVPGEQPQDRAYIKLNTNECPYAPSAAVAQALRALDAATLRLYPDPASVALREALADYYGVAADRVFVGNGSDEVLALACQAFFAPGAESPAVVSPDITYAFYPVYARLYDIPYREVPLRADFSVPVAELAAPSGGVLLANPNATTGRALGLDDLERIVAADSDRVVIVDEAYVDYGAHSALPLLERYDNLLVVMTFSKSRALAGARLGFAFGSRALIEGLERTRDSFNSYPVDRIAAQLGIAALSDGAWFETTRARVMETREATAARLRAMGYAVVPSAANFLLVKAGWPPARREADVAGPGAGSAGFGIYNALREAGILVRHFDRPRIDEFVRISIGTPAEMDAVCEVLRSLSPRGGSCCGADGDRQLESEG